MSRLIDAEHLLFFIDSAIGLRELANIPTSELKNIRECVSEEPTAYDVDEVVEELELHSFEFGTDTLPAHYVRLNDAIEIVKRGGKNEMQK